MMEAIIPKRVFAFVDTKPDENVYEICIALNDVLGAVFEAAKVFSDAHVNIRTSMLFEDAERGNMDYWTSFVDLAASRKSIGKLEEELRNLDVVQDVKIVKPQPLNYDVLHFPIKYRGSTAMIMPVELFGSLYEEIEKILTPSGFAAVFYDGGKKSGVFISQLIGKRYGLKGEDFIKALVQSTQALGWGLVVDLKLDLHRPFCRVRVKGCFEAILRGPRKEAACHWTRGFAAGFLSTIVGETLEAIEVNCAAKGDEFCEFEVCSKI
jgi:predicted hydrocarbon binding protein